MPGRVPAYQTVAATANRNGVKMASKCRSRKKSIAIAIARDRTAMPYRRIVGMEVGDEGSRRAIACLIREPANQRGATRESFRLFALLRDKVTCIAGGPMA